MPNRKYANGRTLEYAALHFLEDNGYWATRAPGSKGAADVIALKPGEILMVQCKLDGYLTSAERDQLYGLAALLGAIPLAARWHKTGREARTVAFERLITPAAACGWTPDHGLERITG